MWQPPGYTSTLNNIHNNLTYQLAWLLTVLIAGDAFYNIAIWLLMIEFVITITFIAKHNILTPCDVVTYCTTQCGC